MGHDQKPVVIVKNESLLVNLNATLNLCIRSNFFSKFTKLECPSQLKYNVLNASSSYVVATWLNITELSMGLKLNVGITLIF